MTKDADLMLAWAVRVDEAELGSRLDTHNATRRQIQSLRLCHAAQISALLSTIPSEVLEMIAEHVYEPVYEERLASWRAVAKCRDNQCEVEDDLSDAQLHNYLKSKEYVMNHRCSTPSLCDGCAPREHHLDHLVYMSREKHYERLREHRDKMKEMSKVSNVRRFFPSDSSLCHCLTLMLQAFRSSKGTMLRPYFCIDSRLQDPEHEDWESFNDVPNGMLIGQMTVSAYIITPITQTDLQWNCEHDESTGESAVSFLLDHDADLGSLDAGRKKAHLFESLLRALKLTAIEEMNKTANEAGTGSADALSALSKAERTINDQQPIAHATSNKAPTLRLKVFAAGNLDHCGCRGL